ncbi:DNA mismatch repair protein MutS [Bacillus shivajii]|uniref:DNA mismatch repair protein MutS n=1 Tax=Bacillus shivajii TaxID=1983719 RepID=UPI001CFAAEBF|nr:DNA mismatch repair protein MutS [Bacillus shivajii]UCZ51643.1 DNA mismatch repair protein MutS [Bacillus shivajii]
MAKQTPMMEQYLRIKAEHEDAFLFFRLGDFYELFFEDAINAAKELEITLTKRGKGDDAIPMCGVPYHSSEQYISQLIEKGYKVAVCEQTEDPQQAKGVVKREVVQIITPGTVMEGRAVQDQENNYLLSITDFSESEYGICAVDMTTGEFLTTVITSSFEDVIHEAASFRPREIVVPASFSEEKQQRLKVRLGITLSYEDKCEDIEELDELVHRLMDDHAVVACKRLLTYIHRTTKRSLDHIQQATYYMLNEYMTIDSYSKRNLELVETIREKKKQGSLLWVLDKTVTAMGARTLKQWVERPLIHKEMITKRLSLVDSFIEHYFERESIRDHLSSVYDLERLSGKVAFGNVNARDLIQLKRSLEEVPRLFDIVQSLGNEYVKELLQQADHCEPLKEILQNSIHEDPPISITEGNIIKDGYNRELDEYRDAMRNGKSWIAQMERKEREETGIKSLKVGFNKVFGYYIEVTKANLHLLPEGRYERKQTLTNAERFISEELKEKEALILEAEENGEKLEYELFMEVREKVKDYIRSLQELANIVSTIDVLQSFAEVAEKNHYVKPKMNDDGDVQIVEGRHPVVEQVIDIGDYVANDLSLNKERELLLITGPNMAGKSTYMRQLALISIMAQIGSYVPADEASLPIFDQIFTRIGAADDLAQGQSTFMVEMLETKHAVSKATKNSLILLDEIGRGTSTYDGMALAQSIIEYIHDEIGAKTLFSTHYHELTTLEKQCERLQNVHVSAIEEDGKVVFLHKVVDGSADRSYGIYVAELAELPEKLIRRAKDILFDYENGQDANVPRVEEKKEVLQEPAVSPGEQLTLFEDTMEQLTNKESASVELDDKDKEALKELKELNLLHVSPIKAIEVLDQLQRKLKS